ncbi:zinc ribbon domain-containing protein [Methanobrevibacter sp.]|uniref:zinc ribbon domain-containing protein n=1 Tax=Methanobrevibacter sp. TaxID=66852 RepID=UPI0038907259
MKICPNCGEQLADEAIFCKSCGVNLDDFVVGKETPAAPQYIPPVEENDHKIAIILGYVGGFIWPIIGLIVAIYLLTRDSEKAKKHGKYVILFSLFIWVVSLLIMNR